MKACVIQPPYSTDLSLADAYFACYLKYLDACDSSMDLIVLPEACDRPCMPRNKEEFRAVVEKYREPLLQKAAETARRCDAVVFCNVAMPAEDGGLRNSTIGFDRQGRMAGRYDKQHLVASEVGKMRLDSGYTYDYSPPTVVEIEGVRYGFLVCYDFYFYEMFANMARQRLDVIIGCSHQRSDTHAALEVMCRHLAYNTNAYVVRASVSMGEDSPLGGCSMIVAPDSTVLADMKSRVGMACAEFDPHHKYLKPAGFGNPPKAHYEYIEDGRRPWKYRPAGSAIVRHDAVMPYPRVCAHRGFNTIAPENSLPAFGAAIALGAEEIEFDLWPTRDGEVVSVHDRTLERVSTGEGHPYDHTYEELLAYDFGVKAGEPFRGLKIIKFEELLQRFACHVVMNVHIKTIDRYGPCDVEWLKKVLALIEQYDCKKYCYFMTNDPVLQQLYELDPTVNRCVGGFGRPWEIVDRAIALGCQKVQLVKDQFDQAMIDKAHAHGIRCNVFWSDDPEETRRYLDMGVDVILTNDYLRIAQTVQAWKREHGLA